MIIGQANFAGLRHLEKCNKQIDNQILALFYEAKKSGWQWAKEDKPFFIGIQGEA